MNTFHNRFFKKMFVAVICIVSLLLLYMNFPVLAQEKTGNCFIAEIDDTVFQGMAITDSAKSLGDNQGVTTGITLEEFKNSYNSAVGNRGIFTFEEFASESIADTNAVSSINMEYGTNKSVKVIATSTPANTNWVVGSVADRTPSSGTAVASTSGAGRLYSFDFSTINGGEEYEKVTTAGFVAVARLTGSVSFAVATTYDNNTTEVMTQTVYGAAGTNENKGNIFFGFKSPDGCSIKKIQIAAVSIENPGTTFLQFDDVCFITDIIVPPPAEATSINITGPDSITQPPWKASLNYQYEGMVRDQRNFDMPEEPITWSVTPSKEGITVSADGLLTISRDAVEEIDSVTLTATAVNADIPAKEYVVSIVSVEPYYRTDRIAKSATPYTVDAFVSDLSVAPQMYVINGGNSDIKHTGSYSEIPYSSDKVAQISKGGVSVQFDGTTGATFVSDTGTALMLNNLPGENKFEIVTEGNDRLTSLGLVVLSRTAFSGTRNITVIATYSNGTEESVTSPVQSSNDNTFFGFKAPLGYFITSFAIEMPDRVWGRCDEIGFIFEQPDSLVLDEDYPLFQFSNFCSQQMNNIKSNLQLPNAFNRCSISWSSTHPEVIDPLSGIITFPDASDKSNVTLTATLKYGVLSKDKKFDLYVPNKLDIDAEKLEFSVLSSEDISSVKNNLNFPTTGITYNSTITWSSSDTSIIELNGNVNRPSGRDKYVTLTATLSNASGQVTKNFGVTVSGTDRDSSGSSGGSSGGGGKTITVPIDSLPKGEAVEPIASELLQKPMFTDIEHVSWASDSIVKLAEAGIVNGVGEGLFDPDSFVTREQFIKMLIEALGLTDMDAQCDYVDVDKSDWYYHAVATAQKLGITEGNGNGTFGSGKKITRQDMAVMTYRAVKTVNIELEKKNDEIQWEDADEISGYASAEISSMQQAGILNGFPGNVFLPMGSATRAQAAVMINSLLEVRNNALQ